jgi:mRNA interferase RelE/StbE
MPSQAKLRVADDVKALIRNLHPILKKRVRAGLEEILEDPFCGKALKDELAGLRSLRIRRLRIIYRLSQQGRISIVAVGPRKNIYEETFRILSRQARNQE